MHPYRVKVPTFFLGLLLLVMLIDAVGSQRIRGKVALLPTMPVEVASEEAFAAMATALSDPAQLRDLAIRQHRQVLASEHLVQTGVSLLRTLSRNLLLQSWGGLFLAVCFYLFEFRSPRRSPQDFI